MQEKPLSCSELKKSSIWWWWKECKWVYTEEQNYNGWILSTVSVRKHMKNFGLDTIYIYWSFRKNSIFDKISWGLVKYEYMQQYDHVREYSKYEETHEEFWSFQKHSFWCDKLRPCEVRAVQFLCSDINIWKSVYSKKQNIYWIKFKSL